MGFSVGLASEILDLSLHIGRFRVVGGDKLKV